MQLLHFAKDLKSIYTAANEDAALERLKAVFEKWEEHYPHAMNRWHDKWDVISPIFKFSKVNGKSRVPLKLGVISFKLSKEM